MSDTEALTYDVDIEAGDESVKRIQQHVRSTYNDSVLSSGETSFGGCFAFDKNQYREPVLVSGTDGVGTKSEIASMMRKYDTIGWDLVAMNVDDVAAQGAKPLFFLDYISIGSIDPEMMEQLVAGIAKACKQAGAVLIGGEMSEHPGLIEPGHFDVSGTAVGVVERNKILPQGISEGDVIVGFDSPGIRSNGYSLVRKVFLEKAKRALDEPAFNGSATSLGEELLRPSVLYSPLMQHIFGSDIEVHACAHITGGGIPGNINRVLGTNFDAEIKRGTWDEPEIFVELQRVGNIEEAEMDRVFNRGIGYTCVVERSFVEEVQEIAGQFSRRGYVIGEIKSGTGKVRYV